jgi:hypothetical protein
MKPMAVVLAHAPLPVLAQAMEGLPPESGFHVRLEAECAAASPTTLTLVHPGGLLGVRDFCRF